MATESVVITGENGRRCFRSDVNRSRAIASAMRSLGSQDVPSESILDVLEAEGWVWKRNMGREASVNSISQHIRQSMRGLVDSKTDRKLGRKLHSLRGGV